jgi:enoyl-CoA hydratase/carnithine racemase
MDTERIQIEIADGVADVRMVRADKHNGLDGRMFTALEEAIDELTADDELRAVVLSGEGPSFCAGLDIKSFMADGGPDLVGLPENTDPPNLAQKVAIGWRQVPVPVIAAVHGACFGGGLQIALGADIRIAAPDARLSVMEIVHGLIPDMSITQTLPRLVRDDVARELTYTGRQVGAEEAQQLGLVTGIDDAPLEAAHELASTIAERSPQAIRNAKRLLNEAPELSAADALRLETELQLQLLGALQASG